MLLNKWICFLKERWKGVTERRGRIIFKKDRTF
jgi:hypothetical protein